MPHIALSEGLPGISAGFAFRPETAKPMRDLAHILLHEPNSLTAGEQEMIATYVSSQNDCYFCQASHGATAACHVGSAEMVQQVKTGFESAPIAPKLKALLAIAGKVQQDGKRVSADEIGEAKAHGATDIEIHDTVLIAAAFCMYNRHVDGLDTWQPRDESMYAGMGKHLAEHGYQKSSR
ncbi:MAG: peroxidase-related enzyme [Acidobacteriaceae bacterium]